MKPVELKIQMLRAGLLQADIVESLNVDQSLVSRVVNNESKNLRVRRHIAEKLDKEIVDIWPEEKFRRPNGRIVEPAGVAA